MALVDYSSSDEDDDTTEETTISTNLKRKRELSASRLPPLPSKFYDLYASTTRVSTRDDANLHGGRKRTTPHIEGNWPTHLYIEWNPTTTEYELLMSLVTPFQDLKSEDGGKVTSLITSELGVPLPLHISLSRPVSFVTGQKDRFVASLHRGIADCGVRPFEVTFIGLDWVPNSEKTRWFLVLCLGKLDGDGLNKLLRVCNRVVEEHGQPPLYASKEVTNFQSGGYERPVKKACNEDNSETPIISSETEVQDFSSAFHVSIGWALEQPTVESADVIKAIVDDKVFQNVKRICFKVEEIKVKVGNTVTNIFLPLKSTEGNGLFGY